MSDKDTSDVSNAVLRKREIYRAWYQHNREKKLNIVKTRSLEILVELAEYQKRYRRSNADKLIRYYDKDIVKQRKRDFNRKRLASMSIETRSKLYRDQHRKKREAVASRPRPVLCEVCQEPAGKKALCWDHDHQLGCFRGWLCDRCNQILGRVKDDPKLLDALAAYLRGHGHE